MICICLCCSNIRAIFCDFSSPPSGVTSGEINIEPWSSLRLSSIAEETWAFVRGVLGSGRDSSFLNKLAMSAFFSLKGFSARTEELTSRDNRLCPLLSLLSSCSITSIDWVSLFKSVSRFKSSLVMLFPCFLFGSFGTEPSLNREQIRYSLLLYFVCWLINQELT